MLNIFNDNNSNSNDEQLSASSAESTSSTDDSFNSLLPLSEFLECSFSDVPKNFNVVHINAESISSCYPEMLASLDYKIHTILVSETWFRPRHQTTSYPLPDFVLIRNDRSPRSGGGVAIYLKANIPFSVVSQSPQLPAENAGEHLFIEVLLSHTKVLLGVYYCPSKILLFFLF